MAPPGPSPASHSFPVRFRAGGRPEVEGHADQANEKGLFIHTAEVHPVNTALTLLIEIPAERREITLTARVIYSNPPRENQRSALPPGMGVKYVDPLKKDLEAVAALGRSAGARQSPSFVRVDTKRAGRVRKKRRSKKPDPTPEPRSWLDRLKALLGGSKGARSKR